MCKGIQILDVSEHALDEKDAHALARICHAVPSLTHVRVRARAVRQKHGAADEDGSDV